MHFTNSKTYIFFSVILLTIFFTACQTSEDKQDEKGHFEPYIISTEEDADNELRDAAVYEGMAYLVSQDNIISYDLASEERLVVAEATGNTAVCVDKEFIYTYNKEQNAVIKYNKKGDVKKTYPCSFEPVKAEFISVLDDMVVIEAKYMNSDGDSESELYKLNMSNGKSNKIPEGFKGKDSYSFILSLDRIDKNTIMITSCVTTNVMNLIIKGYKYDIQKDKVLEEFIIPNNNTYCYNSQKNCFYYTETRGYGNGFVSTSIKEFYPESLINITVNSINDETLNTSFSNNKESFVAKKMYYSEGTIIFWSIYNNCFLVMDQTEKEHLNVILTEKSSLDSKFPLIIAQFEAEYGCPVYITEYPEDIYKDKLRTKLLAGDSDYDIFLLNNPTEDNLLSSILKYELFEPLDSYEDITSNFIQMYDGIRSMMSYNKKLFGVPYNIVYANSKALHYDFKKYGYTIPGKQVTNDDIWNLCDEIIKSGELDVTVFKNADIYDFVNRFIQESINKNHLDKNALTDLLTTIKKYIDAGVLFDYGDSLKESGGKKHLLDFSINYFYSVFVNDIPVYPELGTVLLASNDKKNYLTLNGCLFMNKFSKKKEMAANLIKVMTNSENIYNTEIYQFAMLGSDLTKYDKYNEWSPDRLSYLSDLPNIYKNSTIFNYESTIAGLLRDTITPGFFDGSISPEEAADMIYDQVNYTYFE